MKYEISECDNEKNKKKKKNDQMKTCFNKK